MCFRHFINNYIKKNVFGSSSIPVYCVCDGTDKKQTVIIGASQTIDKLMRTLVFIIGYIPLSHEVMSVDYMRAKHIANVRAAKPQVIYTQ